MIDAEANLLVHILENAKEDDVIDYAQYIHGLLGGGIHYESMPTTGKTSCLHRDDLHGDLVIFSTPEQSCLTRLLTNHPCGKIVAQSTTSFLWARWPRWPIKNILLILRFEETDNAAVEWVCRLAQPSGAAVTILPIVPSLPIMHSLGNHIQTGLDVLLSSNTHAGQRLRFFAQRIAGCQISGDMHMRQGEPEWQIREEVADGNYDLIVIGHEPHGRFHRLLLGELVGPLLYWVERPLLIAQSPRLSA